MIEIPRILCPVDFSDVSRHALDHAITIARWYDSRLTALHVIRQELVIPPPLLFAEFGTVNEIERQAVVEAHLQTWLLPVNRSGVRIDAVVEHGDPARAILRHATFDKFDLVVMGTHGHGGFERLMLGSIAEKVLRRAQCPVMTVPPRAATAAKLPYERLLCPVDFSPSSLEAFRFAFSIAEESNANITVLNVIDYPSEDDLLFARSEALEFRRHMEGEARQQLESLIGGDERMWCKPRTRIEVGKAYERILTVAGEESIDLVVMGVRGRSPMDVALFGSTTNHVARSAPCPVLTIRK